MKVRVTLNLRGASGWTRRGRLVFLLVFALAVSFAARTLFGEKGLLEWWRLRAEATGLQTEVDGLRQALAEERTAVAGLREGSVEVERIAREQLGMIRPGEVIYILPVNPDATEPAGDEESGEP